MTLREQIITAKDITSELLEVPEWGVTVKVKSLSQGARAKLLKETDGGTDTAKFVPELLIGTLVDPLNDQPIFSSADRDVLNEKAVKPVERVLTVAMRVCGFAEVEEIEKKSVATASGDSLSV